MSVLSLKDAQEAVYGSLDNNNEDIDLHIANLKAAMAAIGAAEATFDVARLAQGNRAGRKMMQAYFKKRGVKVVFNA